LLEGGRVGKGRGGGKRRERGRRRVREEGEEG